MRKLCYVLLLAVVFSACNNSQEFKKGKKGIEYKIFPGSNQEKIKVGDFMQLHVGQYYSTAKKDSLLSDTRTGNGPYVEMLDSTSTPPEYFEVLKQLKTNDSLVLRILTDSAFAKSQGPMPTWMKKGNYLMTTVKVIGVFTTRTAADSARMAQMKINHVRDSIKSIETLAKDDKTLQQYFAKNNIKPVKAELGTYVEILQPGSGPNIDTNVVVPVYYTGRTMDGKIFDSNTDSTKGKVEPLQVNMTHERGLGISVIKGWTDGLKLLNKGAKAKFYIPSSLAYGPRESPEIPANSILVFDIEVADIISRQAAKTIADEKMKKNMERRKAMMDSITKARREDSIKAAGGKK